MVTLSMTIEYALLGFLYQQPMHGYEIHQQLKNLQGLGMVWRVKQSRLYALLGKLEKEEYITSVLKPQQARPPRKVFHLTLAGRKTFLDWVKNPVERGRQVRQEFLAKYYFVRSLEPEIGKNLISRQIVSCQQWLIDLHEEASTGTPTASFEWVVHQYRIGQLTAMISWLDTCEEALDH